ncbi:MAG: DUF5103 domain-containing protein [Bacteroidaceae bacterium]|nr:DUF5103 domain-containing protein [Bacteroidaceae bacterium]MBR5891649.1 DUF5103 domain-containing protein [Bacteroidaceae bacterium]
MRKYLILIIFFICTTAINAQFARSMSGNIASLQMVLNNDWSKPAILTLGSDDELCLSFDELSHKYKRFTYRIIHCNSDWSTSELHQVDYIEGFNDRPIENWENSVNTTQLYTNYSFSIPNEDVRLKASGNYKIEIYDDEDDEEPVAVFAFAVLEPKLHVSAKISGNTDIDTNETHQQLSFDVGIAGYNILTPAVDIKPVVYQNRRPDNCVSGITPTYITGTSLQYIYNEKLIFKAGNEYRRFELTDPYAPGQNVDRVEYAEPYYHAELYDDKVKYTYTNTRDENGRYFVNTLQGFGDPMAADYAAVHFTLNAPYDGTGDYYLCGDFNGNFFGAANRMHYDEKSGAYRSVQLLKMGLYNYHYLWVPRGSHVGTTARAEGDFYNTENEYLILIYHRDFGGRHDKLVGMLQIKYDLERN